MRFLPAPQSESNIEALGVMTSAWFEPSVVPAGNAEDQAPALGLPNCQPLRSIDEAPILKISTHSLLALPLIGLNMISLRMADAAASLEPRTPTL
jgi:hypothetical protein